MNATSGYLKTALEIFFSKMIDALLLDRCCQQTLSHAKYETRIVSVLIVAFSFKVLRET